VSWVARAGGMRIGMLSGMPQIAVRLTDDELARLDASVARGHHPSRAAAVRAGLERLLHEERDRELADAYRDAYGRAPQDELGDAGALLAAEVADEDAARRPGA